MQGGPRWRWFKRTFRMAGVSLDGMLGEVREAVASGCARGGKGNKTEAAKLLQMSFRSFRYRLAKLGLDEIATD